MLKKFDENELNNIIESINNNTIFEDSNFVISRDYICDKNDLTLLIKLDDIKEVNKQYRKNKWRIMINFQAYKYCDTHYANKIIRLIQYLRPNIKIGYYNGKLLDGNTLIKEEYPNLNKKNKN